MGYVRPDMSELEAEAYIEYQFKKMGCRRLGYDSIVASGANACCLHYRRNQDVMRDGDLLLVDAAGEYEYYSSDITRTFPVGKVFSKPQRLLYAAVLKAQKACIAMIRPGVKLPELHENAAQILSEELCQVGLLKGPGPDRVRDLSFKRFFPHGTSHWLGMDVHDAGLYTRSGQPRALEAGMCFTVEPGIYVQPTDVEADQTYRGIGIRVEDDVVVTASGVMVLTGEAPKELEELEDIRQNATRTV
jgi:Xaa-Pro aminopeptidase